ncbi:hypothetical protein FSP39_010397, partial [Pinctada imbricata]
PKRKLIRPTMSSVDIGWDYSDFAMKFAEDRMKLKIRRSPTATVGKPWPLPQEYSTGDKLFKIDLKQFSIDASKVWCEIIEKAIDRYRKILYMAAGQFANDNMEPLGKFGLHGVMEENITRKIEEAMEMKFLTISIDTNCSYIPDISSDESYTLLVKPIGAFIKANEVWGALRGLETFSQLIIHKGGQYYIPETTIYDFPRFPHRGVLIDSSRHYMSKNVIFDVMDGMVMNKMNVFHWHIVDDQSFPYQSQVFPELSAKGAYHPLLIYTFDDIREVIEYGRLRGIRVIPEFDTPGHTFSWGFSHPELLTQCYKSQHPIPGYLGPMDPSKASTYEFLAQFFKEAIQLFPDDFLHLGGDEVPIECWMFQVSQDNAVINIWMGTPRHVGDVTQAGYRALYSSCWYLDHVDYGVHWPKYYKCDPTGPGFRGDENLVLGGEACLWSEFITNNDAVRLLWPRASAVAERLWSNSSARDVNSAGRRLQEHRCRMFRRGLKVGHINGPDYCLIPKDRETNNNSGKSFLRFFPDKPPRLNFKMQQDIWITDAYIWEEEIMPVDFTDKQGGKKYGQLRKEQEAILDDINQTFADDTDYVEEYEDLADRLQRYKEQFMEFDEDNSGDIDIMELKRMMEKLGQAKTHLELKKMIAEVDTTDSGTIHYNEFVGMMLGKKSSVLKLILMFEEKKKEKEKPKGVAPKKSLSDLP